jgi:D-aminoacyl-tRNA deacylase
MKAVLQRVSRASVSVNGVQVGSIGEGILVFLAAGVGDGEEQVRKLSTKITRLRIFPDDRGKLNLSLVDVGGEVLVVSQFTLYGDCRKGTRPSYSQAAPTDQARQLCRDFITAVRDQGITVKEGMFGAMMSVELVNEGPVTLIVETH